MPSDPKTSARDDGGGSRQPHPPWSPEAIERMRLRLIRSEQLAAVGRVVAGLAHEINNPLTGLLGSIEIMQEMVSPTGAAPAAGPDASRDELRGLLLDCGTMVDRIRELMNAVRGMSRDSAKDYVAFDPGRAIRDAARVFAIARRNRCHLDLSLPGLPAIKGSPGRLGQVMLNLLQNGVDASADGGQLSIVAESTGSHVRITVADRGTGIPADVAEHVFEPFFTSKNVDEGTGLGLYICREIVTSMGGTIGFETSPAGTTFRVDLPAHLPESDQRPQLLARVDSARDAARRSECAE
jgi:signal transduction histidine kinase